MKLAHSPTLAEQVLTWFDTHGRKNLPWQLNKNHYRVWVSEVMLQQTQVSTVLRYFDRFIQRFPTVQSLAQAPADEVLSYWTGLGYYARARNLHKAAIFITEKLGGEFPRTLDQVIQLPGLARSTASAILALVDENPLPILDGNVKRVLSRYFAISGPINDPKTIEKLWSFAETEMPQNRVADYTQAMMDLGATLCTRSQPNCPQCPIKSHCQAFLHEQVAHYPEPAKRQKISHKTAYFACVLTPDQHILLKPRPSEGIWGGLWTFPIFETEAELLNWESQHCPEPLSRGLGPTQKHLFTHFRLDYTPVILEVQGPFSLTEGAWMTLSEALRVGLPAPILKLIQKLGDRHANDLLSKIEN